MPHPPVADERLTASENPAKRQRTEANDTEAKVNNIMAHFTAAEHPPITSEVPTDEPASQPSQAQAAVLSQSAGPVSMSRWVGMAGKRTAEGAQPAPDTGATVGHKSKHR